MSQNNISLIKEIYTNKSFSILSVPITQSEYLAFCYSDFQLLLSLFKSESILISSIELFDKKSYGITPPSFWYSGKNMEECSNLIEDFLGKLIDRNNHYYTFWLNSSDRNTLELKIALAKISTLKTPLNKN